MHPQIDPLLRKAVKAARSGIAKAPTSMLGLAVRWLGGWGELGSMFVCDSYEALSATCHSGRMRIPVQWMHLSWLSTAGVFLCQVFNVKVGKYVPDFKTVVSHFAIHPGGKAVIDAVGDALSLRPEQLQPCRAAFERYGNTSSSSTWYGLYLAVCYTGCI